MGAGVQARTQLSALEAVLPTFEQVRVWDIDHERADAFRERSDRVVPVANAEDACRRTDVIVAATMAPEPYVPAEWLGPCSLFGSVSSLDAEISCVERADLVVCDLWDHETGHASRPLARALAAGVISRDDVIELPDLVAGRHPGRATDEQRIFSSPVGLAIEDVAAAARVYRRAEELGIGTRLSLWESPIWV